MPNEAPAPAGSMSVRFWGVRGSIPSPGRSTLRYGGNTPCVEIRCGAHTLIFDAGTGIRALGNALVEAGNTSDFDIFLSHGHIDHVVGLPFFAPMFVEKQIVRIWAGTLQAAGGVQESVRKLMSFPFFPLQVDALHAKLEFRDFRAGEKLQPRPDVTIATAPLHHPGGAVGYRVEHDGKAVAYVTDVEMGNGAIDPALLALTKGAELVILDTTYTDAELPSHVGWVIRLGSKVSGWSKPPERRGCACSTTIPITTTTRWIQSRPPPMRRCRERWSRAKACGSISERAA
jgi:phosphoribosyl 1,2-cyclic phosphodiesterase